jgi:hypothetical protein
LTTFWGAPLPDESALLTAGRKAGAELPDELESLDLLAATELAEALEPLD